MVGVERFVKLHEGKVAEMQKYINHSHKSLGPQNKSFDTHVCPNYFFYVTRRITQETWEFLLHLKAHQVSTIDKLACLATSKENVSQAH